MSLSKIKLILASGELSANQVNPIINTLKIEDLDGLSELEKENLREVISKFLVLTQDLSSGAYLGDPEKAESLLSAID